MTYLAVALVMFVLGYLVGALAAAVGVWAEREKTKLVVDGLAEANRGLMDAVKQLVGPVPAVSSTARFNPNEQRTYTTQSVSTSRGTN
jgi:hypothetical protein